MATEIIGTNNTSLTRSPFYSRFTQFEGTENNYVLIGFTPGLALQAAELNELQDNFHKVTTLSNLLISNWTIHSIKNSDNLDNVTGFLWDGAVPLSPTMVTVANNVVTLSRGWYYITESSGLKYWIHLNLAQEISTLDSATGFISLTLSSTDVFANTDTRLYDNSTGNPNTNSPGSYRVAKNFSSASFTTSNADTTRFYILQKTAVDAFNWINGLQL